MRAGLEAIAIAVVGLFAALPAEVDDADPGAEAVPVGVEGVAGVVADAAEFVIVQPLASHHVR
jgi:hypothetical protein